MTTQKKKSQWSSYVHERRNYVRKFALTCSHFFNLSLQPRKFRIYDVVLSTSNVNKRNGLEQQQQQFQRRGIKHWSKVVDGSTSTHFVESAEQCWTSECHTVSSKFHTYSSTTCSKYSTTATTKLSIKNQLTKFTNTKSDVSTTDDEPPCNSNAFAEPSNAIFSQFSSESASSYHWGTSIRHSTTITIGWR